MKDTPGFIVTFYSYKGGVGRTMAVANVAVLLAQQGLKTLAIDFDLEAPGLHRYFSDYGVRPDDANEGMLDILVEARDGKESRWRERLVPVALRSSGDLSILTSGRHDDRYPQRVLDFNWRLFFEKQGGGQHIEKIRNEWRSEFDVVLVDSRTGITDSGGVCTIQLPDVLVPMFTANEQSVQGCRDVALAAQQARQNLAFDRPPLLIFPLPSRFDGRAQYVESRTWLTTFAHELGTFYDTWLPKSLSPRSVLERTKLPYVAFFSFGEKLPVVTEGTSDPESLGYALATAATLIGSKFQDAEQILFGGPLPADKVEPSASAELLLEQWERTALRNADAHRRAADRKRRDAVLGRAGAVLATVIGGAIVGVATAAWLIGAAALLLVLLTITWQLLRGAFEPTAKHLAASTGWEAIAHEAVEMSRSSSSSEAVREHVDLLRNRIETLEAEGPALASGDLALPGQQTQAPSLWLASTADNVVAILQSKRAAPVLRAIWIIFASLLVVSVALAVADALINALNLAVPAGVTRTVSGWAWIVLSVVGILYFRKGADAADKEE